VAGTVYIHIFIHDEYEAATGRWGEREREEGGKEGEKCAEGRSGGREGRGGRQFQGWAEARESFHFYLETRKIGNKRI